MLSIPKYLEQYAQLLPAIFYLLCCALQHHVGGGPASHIEKRPFSSPKHTNDQPGCEAQITSQRLLDQSQAGVYMGKTPHTPHFGPFWAYSRTLPQGVELLV